MQFSPDRTDRLTDLPTYRLRERHWPVAPCRHRHRRHLHRPRRLSTSDRRVRRRQDADDAGRSGARRRDRAGRDAGAANAAMGAVGPVVHGTTLVTNALIERKGAPTALLTTEGFRDALEIGREHRYDMYDLLSSCRARSCRATCASRCRSACSPTASTLPGSIWTRRRRAAGRASWPRPASRRSRSPSSTASPTRSTSGARGEPVRRAAPDRRASRLVRRGAGDPRVRAHLDHRRQRLRAGPGRALPARLEERLARAGFARRALLHALLRRHWPPSRPPPASRSGCSSPGPAAGALAAAAFGAAAGYDGLLSFDMGGTTAKLRVIDRGEPLLAHDFEVARATASRRAAGCRSRCP